jgi:dipeptidyl aminopeptidase/acylaminoacyl peptidase
MAAIFPARPRAILAAAVFFFLSVGASAPAQVGQPAIRVPDFDRMLRDQAETDRRWLEASAGFMQMEKIEYRSGAGDLDIPVFVFQPLKVGSAKTHPALIWVHENIRGHLYEHYIPYVRDATARGYVVIAPEYRGSIGYGKALYDAIDYGGAEIDDIMGAVGALTA